MIETGTELEIQRFKDLENGLCKMIERGSPLWIAVDNPEDPRMILTLNSIHEWSVKIGEKNLRIGANPSMRRLLNSYALIKDKGYIELAQEKCDEETCQNQMSEYLSENMSRIFESLTSNMETIQKALKGGEEPPLPFPIQILKHVL